MNVSIKHVYFGFILIFFWAISATSCEQNIPFSFDTMYPTSSVTRTLNALRYAWSLTADTEIHLYNLDTMRHMWLDIYSAAAELARDQQTQRMFCSNGVLLKDDMREYITTTWHLVDEAYAKLPYSDASFGSFVTHMRIAIAHIIDLL